MRDLIQKYLLLAAQWGESLSGDNARKSNKIYDAIEEVFAQIQADGNVDLLFEHLNDSNEAIRFWIAGHIKEIDIQKSKDVYRELTSSTIPAIAVSSRYILKELGESI